MAKRAYIGVDGVAKKIIKGYIGVDNVAKRIKKAYIGVGGVAKPFWSIGKMSRHGYISNLSDERAPMAAASIGGYALFAGGLTSSSRSSAVDAYDSSLSRKIPTSLQYAKDVGVGATAAGYAMFAGLRPNTKYNNVDAYNSSLSRKNPSINLLQSRQGYAAASIGNCVMFVGGYIKESSGLTTYNRTVEGYDSSLTKITYTGLNYARKNLAATTVNGVAIIAGGEDGNGPVNYVDVYNSSGTKMSIDDSQWLSKARSKLRATSVGNYAIFAGGWENDAHDVVDVYDSLGTRHATYSLYCAGAEAGATTVGDYAVFAGGSYSSGATSYTSVRKVYAYDSSLSQSFLEDVDYAGTFIGATAGNYAIFVETNDYGGCGYAYVYSE